MTLWLRDYLTSFYGEDDDDSATFTSLTDDDQTRLFRQAADAKLIADADDPRDTTLNLIDLIEYGRDSLPLPDDASLTEGLDED